jgi:hypothetical protein
MANTRATALLTAVMGLAFAQADRAVGSIRQPAGLITVNRGPAAGMDDLRCATLRVISATSRPYITRSVRSRSGATFTLRHSRWLRLPREIRR